MKFRTIKEMESELKKVTNLKDLKQDITFLSQGETELARYISEGNAMGQRETIYISDETSANMRVEFSGDGDNITVTTVKVNRY